MKGSLQDMPLIAIILVMTALTIFVTYIMITAFFDAAPIQAVPEAAAMESYGISGLVILGNAFLYIFITFGIISAIASYYTETHPVFFVFSIIIFAICVMIVGIFSDLFTELASSQALLPMAAEFVIMTQTMTNLTNLSIILGCIIVMALYAKRSDLQLGRGGA